MSSVTIQPNAGGAGVFTIATPSSSTNYTLNLPAENGTLLTSASTTNLGSKIQPIDATSSSGSLTVTLNPTVLDFRSSTTSSGTVNTRTINSAISVIVPSGATLGTVSGQQSFIMVLAIDNAGTVELAVVNLGSFSLSETTLISTSAINSGSTSASTVYSTTARTNVPYRVVGFISSTQTTAGVWVIPAATGTTTIQGIGGQAMAGMNTLGYGQSWQSFTVGSTRVLGTTYYNTTGRPIVVSFSGTAGTSTNCQLTISGLLVAQSGGDTTNGASNASISGIVPPGASYSIASTRTTNVWFELR